MKCSSTPRDGHSRLERAYTEQHNAMAILPLKHHNHIDVDAWRFSPWNNIITSTLTHENILSSPTVDWILKQKNPVFFAQKNARRIFLGMDVVQYAFYSLKTSNSCSASTHRPHACRYVTKKPCFRRFKIVKRREHKMFHFLMNLYTKRTTDFLGMDVVEYAFYSLETSNSCSASTHRPHACRYVTKKPCFRWFKILKRREHEMFHFFNECIHQ